MNMKKAILSITLVIGALALHATDFVSIASGDWNDPANWMPSGVPNVTNSAAWPGDNVTISHAITYTGDLATEKRSSIDIQNGGSLSVSGTLDISNNNTPSSFDLRSGGTLMANNLIVSTCCSTVTLDGTVATNGFSFPGSKPISIGGDITVSGDFDGGNNSSINFTGGSLTVTGSSTLGGSLAVNVDGGAQLNFGELSLSGNADVIGVNTGGAIGFNSLSFANSSTTIQCVSNSCNYNGTTSTPPNPLDLVTGAQALPVELKTFTATAQNNTATLSWSTVSESDNDFFLLEHSTDGRSFATLATFVGAGNSTQLASYEYIHEKLSTASHYYRLWQYDYDGSNTMLGIREVKVSDSSFGVDKISPNPAFAGQSIQLSSSSSLSAATVRLLSSNGQSWLLSIAEGTQQVQLPTTLPAGMYFLRIERREELQTIPVVIISN